MHSSAAPRRRSKDATKAGTFVALVVVAVMAPEELEAISSQGDGVGTCGTPRRAGRAGISPSFGFSGDSFSFNDHCLAVMHQPIDQSGGQDIVLVAERGFGGGRFRGFRRAGVAAGLV